MKAQDQRCNRAPLAVVSLGAEVLEDRLCGSVSPGGRGDVAQLVSGVAVIGMFPCEFGFRHPSFMLPKPLCRTVGASRQPTHPGPLVVFLKCVHCNFSVSKVSLKMIKRIAGILNVSFI